MSDDVRARIVRSRATLSASSTIAFRNRRTAEVTEQAREKKVFRIEDDQPVIELLKSARVPLQHFREGKHTHVSDIIGKCARQIALIRRMGIRHAPRSVPDGHAITFEQGHVIGEFVKRRFVEGHPNKVWAQWRCRCGKTLLEPMTFSAVGGQACEHCGGKPDQHVEVPFVDEEHGVVGSPDVILYLESFPAYHIVEVKSMNKEQWDSLVRPVPDHIIQGLFYWRLMRQYGYSLTNRVSVLYVKKEYSWKLPYKEFLIDPVSERGKEALTLYLRDLKLIKNAKDARAELPARTACGTPSAPDAKTCPVCVTCFQLSPERKSAAP